MLKITSTPWVLWVHVQRISKNPCLFKGSLGKCFHGTKPLCCAEVNFGHSDRAVPKEVLRAAKLLVLWLGFHLSGFTWELEKVLPTYP